MQKAEVQNLIGGDGVTIAGPSSVELRGRGGLSDQIRQDQKARFDQQRLSELLEQKRLVAAVPWQPRGTFNPSPDALAFSVPDVIDPAQVDFFRIFKVSIAQAEQHQMLLLTSRDGMNLGHARVDRLTGVAAKTALAYAEQQRNRFIHVDAVDWYGYQLIDADCVAALSRQGEIVFAAEDFIIVQNSDFTQSLLAETLEGIKNNKGRNINDILYFWTLNKSCKQQVLPLAKSIRVAVSRQHDAVPMRGNELDTSSPGQCAYVRKLLAEKRIVFLKTELSAYGLFASIGYIPEDYRRDMVDLEHLYNVRAMEQAQREGKATNVWLLGVNDSHLNFVFQIGQLVISGPIVEEISSQYNIL